MPLPVTLIPAVSAQPSTYYVITVPQAVVAAKLAAVQPVRSVVVQTVVTPVMYDELITAAPIQEAPVVHTQTASTAPTTAKKATS